MTDFQLTDRGSICVLRPMNDEAREWIDFNVDPDAQWFGRGVVIEPRYVSDIAEGIVSDGLSIGG